MSNDLTLFVKIRAQVKQAIDALKDVRKNLENLSKVSVKVRARVQAVAQRSELDLMAWGNAFKALGLMGVGAMYALIQASPSLGAQFAQVSFAANNLAMVIGESLAPYLQGLTDFIVKVLNWIAKLPAPIREWIGLTIALSAAVGVLTIAIIAMNAALSPELLIILAIIAAIAALIIAVKYASQHYKEWIAYLLNLNDTILFLLGPIGWVILLFKHWGEILNWLQGIFDVVSAFIKDKIDVIVEAWENALEKLKEGWEWFKGLFANVKEFFGDILQGIEDAISGVVIGFLNLLIDGINTFLNPLKTFFEKLKNWKALPEWIRNVIPDIELVPKFHSGGFVPGDGEMLAILQGGEYVLSRQQVAALQSTRVPSGNTINITLNIDQPVLRDTQDIDELAYRVSQKIREELERGASW